MVRVLVIPPLCAHRFLRHGHRYRPKTTTVMSLFMDVTALISIALVGPILGV